MYCIGIDKDNFISKYFNTKNQNQISQDDTTEIKWPNFLT